MQFFYGSQDNANDFKLLKGCLLLLPGLILVLVWLGRQNYFFNSELAVVAALRTESS